MIKPQNDDRKFFWIVVIAFSIILCAFIAWAIFLEIFKTKT